MRKSNIMTMLLFCFIIISVCIFMVFSKSDTIANEQPIKEDTNSTTQTNSTRQQEGKDDIPKKQPEKPKALTLSMDKSLFIGDSRTVGLMEYAQIKGADFFCNVGMSVFNIYSDSISVPNVGKVTLRELLDNKKYDKIYIMLGINELGYHFEKIIEKYEELIQFVKEREPETTIFIQANLHVTAKRSDNDKVFNNNSIDSLNIALSKLANNKDIFYLNVNLLFDDNMGNLSADKSSDNTHLYAKYYKLWGKWIVNQTAKLIKEE